MEDYQGQVDFPELYFNIQMNRKIIDPFISYLVPVLVVLLMLFSIFTLGRKDDRVGVLGFTSLDAISVTSALFFVVIFNHISMRDDLSASGVVYFEYFFFVTYLAILFVSLDSILIALCKDSRFVKYKDNFLPRLYFWPVIFGFLFIVSILKLS